MSWSAESHHRPHHRDRRPSRDRTSSRRGDLSRTAPDARVLILTTFEQDDYIFGALRAGASGFLLKRTRPEELIAAVPPGHRPRGPTTHTSARLVVEESTIRSHVKRILMKLHLRDRVQAVIYAYETGLTQPAP